MNNNHSDTVSATALLLCASTQWGLSMFFWGGALFLAAGTLLWSRGWIHLGLWLATLPVNFTVLLQANREVLAARFNPKRASEGWDRLLLAVFLPLGLTIPVIGGLEAVRYQQPSVPVWGIYLGILLHVAGDVLMVWTMAVNPYLEKTVRIQAERAHRVIVTGPYAWVRHPMYAAVILLLASIPLVLGSVWAFAPVALIAALLIVRTLLEEQTLRRSLPGYEDYAQQTRYRIIPRIW